MTKAEEPVELTAVLKEDIAWGVKAVITLGEFIEEVYNNKRLHSSLGYLSPVEFEGQHALKAGS